MKKGASMAEIVVEGGPRSVHCPVTGIPLVVENEGFDPNGEHSPYVRFVIDWVGQAYVAPPDALPSEGRAIQEILVELLQDPAFETANQMVDACTDVLPQSSVVMEYLDPPHGSFGGSIFYVCFEHSPGLMGAGEGQPRRRPLMEVR